MADNPNVTIWHTASETTVVSLAKYQISLTDIVCSTPTASYYTSDGATPTVNIAFVVQPKDSELSARRYSSGSISVDLKHGTEGAVYDDPSDSAMNSFDVFN